ncbi:MAG: exosortase-associated EpsI family protein [Planctomycetales bacterium]|nr:exosortase-associated EpsI family protein [Planctomycetales bacterium]
MTRLYVPAGVALLLMLGMTWQEAKFSDRFTGSSVSEAELNARFSKVPLEVGPWKGVAQAVSQEVLDAAGAVGHVNRRYQNEETGDVVDLWLIVGHAREICRHTPDICYPSNGFSPIGTPLVMEFDRSDGAEAEFKSAKFRSESEQSGLQVVRVFWAWNGNEGEHTNWEAPEYQKQHFGNNPALYKVYFKYQLKKNDEDDLKNSPAAEFGSVMLPVIDRTIFPERFDGTPAADTPSADGAPGDVPSGAETEETQAAAE